MKNIDLTTLFDLYLNKSLSSADLQAFENRLKTEPDLRKELEAHRLALAEIKKHNASLDHIARLDEEVKKELQGKAKIIGMKRWLSAAAAIFLLAITYFLWSNQQQPSLENLMAAYDQPQDLGLKSGNETISTFEAALQKKDYQKAITAYLAEPNPNEEFKQATNCPLNQKAAEKIVNAEVRATTISEANYAKRSVIMRCSPFLLAYAYKQTDNYQKSHNIWNAIISENTVENPKAKHQNRIKAHWQKALAYVNEKQNTAALKELDILLKDPHLAKVEKEKAEKLRKAL